MTERSVVLTEKEILALAHLEAADRIDSYGELFNDYPAVSRKSMSAVADALDAIIEHHYELAAAAVGGREAVDALTTRALLGGGK